jgi:uncharacterized protein YueI
MHYVQRTTNGMNQLQKRCISKRNLFPRDIVDYVGVLTKRVMTNITSAAAKQKLFVEVIAESCGI